jgi:hypothetical protein
MQWLLIGERRQLTASAHFLLFRAYHAKPHQARRPFGQAAARCADFVRAIHAFRMPNACRVRSGRVANVDVLHDEQHVQRTRSHILHRTVHSVD